MAAIGLTNAYLEQWFLTLLEVLNPSSSIHAFIEPFVVAKIKCVSWILFLLFKISCRRTSKTDSSNPWGSIEPRLRTTDLENPDNLKLTRSQDPVLSQLWEPSLLINVSPQSFNTTRNMFTRLRHYFEYFYTASISIIKVYIEYIRFNTP